MGLFSCKSTKPARIPSPEEIDEAGRQLAAGKSKLADKLADGAGDHSQWVAMQILAASVDHMPAEES